MGKTFLGVVLGLIVAAVLGVGSANMQKASAAQSAGLAAGTVDSGQCSREQEAANKQLIASLPPSPDGLLQAMHPDYIQHSPEFIRFGELNGVKAREAFALMATAYKLTGMLHPKPPAGMPRNNPNYMIVAECDIVIMLRQQWAADPQNPGKFYEYFASDVFRIKDGKLYEHWDGGMIPDPAPRYLQTSVKDLQAEKRYGP